MFPFNEELLADEFPVLVKFHEIWCSRCKHMKSAFEYAASKTVGRIMFMEVECSSTVETRKFCGKHHIDGFPTLKLMVCAASTRFHSPLRRAASLLAPLMLMPPRCTITPNAACLLPHERLLVFCVSRDCVCHGWYSMAGRADEAGSWL